MPIHDAAYRGSPCALHVLASSAISLAKFAALVSMITWRRRASAARGIVRRLTTTTSVHELAASKARTNPDPTCPVPPTTKTRKPMLCLSPSNIARGIFKPDSAAAYERLGSLVLDVSLSQATNVCFSANILMSRNTALGRSEPVALGNVAHRARHGPLRTPVNVGNREGQHSAVTPLRPSRRPREWLQS